jgi:hypothetical protein
VKGQLKVDWLSNFFLSHQPAEGCFPAGCVGFRAEDAERTAQGNSLRGSLSSVVPVPGALQPEVALLTFDLGRVG